MFELVELLVSTSITGNNVDIYFTQQPQLQTIVNDKQIYVKGIETFSNGALTTSPLTSGNPVATPADIQNATLTLVVEGTETLKRIPLALLNRSFATGGAFVPLASNLFMLKNIFEVNWVKSYVTVVLAPASVPFSYLFGVHYEYAPDDY